MSFSAESIARKLGGARKSGLDWSCRCPAHDDQKSSLSITDKSGKLLVRCHAGCQQAAVISQLKRLDLWPGASVSDEPRVEINLPRVVQAEPVVQKAARSERGRVVATYDYTDEKGELLFQALRFEPKDFRQRAPDGSWSIKGCRRVPYRLPKVIEAVKQGITVYIVEGEKDVHAAESLGLVATCNPMGADNGTGNKWLPEFAQYFKGASVVVVPDQDEPGRRHAEWVISTLLSSARSVRICNPKSGKDLSDWIDVGATLTDIIDAQEPIEVEAKKPRFELLSFDQVSALPPVSWLIKDVMPAQGIGAVYGPSRSGKSFLVLDLLGAVASDRAEWFGNRIKAHVPVVYLALEGEHGVPQRIRAYIEERGVPEREFRFIFTGLSILKPEDVDALIQSIKALGMEHPIVCIDTLNQATPGMDENSSEMGLAIQAMKRIQRETEGLVMIVHHTGKDETKGLRGHSSLLAALDFSIVVTRGEEARSWRSDKIKDGADDKEFFFGLKTVELGEDEDGDPLTSCVVVEKEDADFITAVVGQTVEGKPITVAQALKAFMDRSSLQAVADGLGTTKAKAQRLSNDLAGRGLLIKGQTGRASISEKGLQVLSQTGALLPHANQKSDVPVWKRGPERADIDL
ncbi:MAG: hypothetical protein EBR49_15705 [Betaproteobacteria bacterium]|nr:hypothetical protein [Betaproteobacteria bacterium]